MKHTFLVSDESVNSYGFKVLTSGIDTSQFEKNPIMLYMHERSNVIGKWENLRKEDGKMYADAVFDMEDETAKFIAGKVERGFLKSASLGIILNEKDGDLIKECFLYEISIVDVGSNKNALKLYDKKEMKLFFNFNNNPMNLQESIITLLDLDVNATQEDVLKKVQELKELANTEQENKKKEAQLTLKNALHQGRITAEMMPQFSKMLELDFEGTKNLLSSMPERQTLADKITNTGFEAKNNSHEKPKHLWNLEDYRKFAPNDLRDNPQLYKELKQKENLITK